MAQPLHTPADSLLLLTGQPAGGELGMRSSPMG